MTPQPDALEKMAPLSPVYLAAGQTRDPQLPPLRAQPGARTLENVVVARAGDGEGHGFFADNTFLAQIVEHGNAAPGGLKSRFGHPPGFEDAIGTEYGYLDGFRLIGDTALANLHVYESANALPRLGGANVAVWLLGDGTPTNPGFATEAPEKIGLSAAFFHDVRAMATFYSENLDANGDFHSPDPRNRENLPHWRMSELVAADLVDRAALNPRHGLLAARPDLAALSSQLQTGNPPTKTDKGAPPMPPTAETNLAAVTLDELSTGNPNLLATIRTAAGDTARDAERRRCVLIFSSLAALVPELRDPTALIKKAGELIGAGAEARLADANNPATLAGEAVSELKLLAAQELNRGNAPSPGSNLAAGDTPTRPATVLAPQNDGGQSRLAAANAYRAANPTASMADALRAVAAQAN